MIKETASAGLLAYNVGLAVGFLNAHAVDTKTLKKLRQTENKWQRVSQALLDLARILI